MVLLLRPRRLTGAPLLKAVTSDPYTAHKGHKVTYVDKENGKTYHATVTYAGPKSVKLKYYLPADKVAGTKAHYEDMYYTKDQWDEFVNEHNPKITAPVVKKATTTKPEKTAVTTGLPLKATVSEPAPAFSSEKKKAPLSLPAFPPPVGTKYIVLAQTGSHYVYTVTSPPDADGLIQVKYFSSQSNGKPEALGFDGNQAMGASQWNDLVASKGTSGDKVTKVFQVGEEAVQESTPAVAPAPPKHEQFTVPEDPEAGLTFSVADKPSKLTPLTHTYTITHVAKDTGKLTYSWVNDKGGKGEDTQTFSQWEEFAQYLNNPSNGYTNTLLPSTSVKTESLPASPAADSVALFKDDPKPGMTMQYTPQGGGEPWDVKIKSVSKKYVSVIINKHDKGMPTMSVVPKDVWKTQYWNLGTITEPTKGVVAESAATAPGASSLHSASDTPMSLGDHPQVGAKAHYTINWDGSTYHWQMEITDDGTDSGEVWAAISPDPAAGMAMSGKGNESDVHYPPDAFASWYNTNIAPTVSKTELPGGEPAPSTPSPKTPLKENVAEHTEDFKNNPKPGQKFALTHPSASQPFNIVVKDIEKNTENDEPIVHFSSQFGGGLKPTNFDYTLSEWKQMFSDMTVADYSGTQPTVSEPVEEELIALGESFANPKEQAKNHPKPGMTFSLKYSDAEKSYVVKVVSLDKNADGSSPLIHFSSLYGNNTNASTFNHSPAEWAQMLDGATVFTPISGFEPMPTGKKKLTMTLPSVKMPDMPGGKDIQKPGSKGGHPHLNKKGKWDYHDLPKGKQPAAPEETPAPEEAVPAQPLIVAKKGVVQSDSQKIIDRVLAKPEVGAVLLVHKPPTDGHKAQNIMAVVASINDDGTVASWELVKKQKEDTTLDAAAFQDGKYINASLGEVSAKNFLKKVGGGDVYAGYTREESEAAYLAVHKPIITKNGDYVSDEERAILSANPQVGLVAAQGGYGSHTYTVNAVGVGGLQVTEAYGEELYAPRMMDWKEWRHLMSDVSLTAMTPEQAAAKKKFNEEKVIRKRMMQEPHDQDGMTVTLPDGTKETYTLTAKATDSDWWTLTTVRDNGDAFSQKVSNDLWRRLASVALGGSTGLTVDVHPGKSTVGGYVDPSLGDFPVDGALIVGGSGATEGVVFRVQKAKNGDGVDIVNANTGVPFTTSIPRYAVYDKYGNGFMPYEPGNPPLPAALLYQDFVYNADYGVNDLKAGVEATYFDLDRAELDDTFWKQPYNDVRNSIEKLILAAPHVGLPVTVTSDDTAWFSGFDAKNMTKGTVWHIKELVPGHVVALTNEGGNEVVLPMTSWVGAVRSGVLSVAPNDFLAGMKARVKDEDTGKYVDVPLLEGVTCPYCHDHFTKGSLKTHEGICPARGTCDICGEHFSTHSYDPCGFCHGHFCGNHLTPEKHHCTGAATCEMCQSPYPKDNAHTCDECHKVMCESCWDKHTHDGYVIAHGDYRSMAKDRLCKHLAARLKDNPDYQKLAGMSSESEGIFASFSAEHDGDNGYRAADIMIGNWAGTSSRDALAIAMQEAVVAEFGLVDPARTWIERYGNEADTQEGMKYYKQWEKGLRAFVRAMYDETQEEFAKRGMKTIRVWRGQSFSRSSPSEEEGKLIAEWDGMDNKESDAVVKDCHLRLHPMSSFSTNLDVAKNFTSSNSYGDSRQVIISMDLPVTDVVGTAITGYGCLNEEEIVVMHKHDRISHVAPSEYYFKKKWGSPQLEESYGNQIEMTAAKKKHQKLVNPDSKIWTGLLEKSSGDLPTLGLDNDPNDADWPKRTWDWPGGRLRYGALLPRRTLAQTVSERTMQKSVLSGRWHDVSRERRDMKGRWTDGVSMSTPVSSGKIRVTIKDYSEVVGTADEAASCLWRAGYSEKLVPQNALGLIMTLATNDGQAKGNMAFGTLRNTKGVPCGQWRMVQNRLTGRAVLETDVSELFRRAPWALMRVWPKQALESYLDGIFGRHVWGRNADIGIEGAGRAEKASDFDGKVARATMANR